MREQPIPYDTGKVKIGVYYEIPKPIPTYEETMIQSVLLGVPVREQPSLFRMLKDFIFGASHA